jgi:hypothetical protein
MSTSSEDSEEFLKFLERELMELERQQSMDAEVEVVEGEEHMIIDHSDDEDSSCDPFSYR